MINRKSVTMRPPVQYTAVQKYNVANPCADPPQKLEGQLLISTIKICTRTYLYAMAVFGYVHMSGPSIGKFPKGLPTAPHGSAKNSGPFCRNFSPRISPISIKLIRAMVAIVIFDKHVHSLEHSGTVSKGISTVMNGGKM